MTELQKAILNRQNLADQQKAVFSKYADVAMITEEELKEIEERNAQMKSLDAEIEKLTRIEEMAATAMKATRQVHHGNPGDTLPAGGQSIEEKRMLESKRVEVLPRHGVVTAFKGQDAALKAYQLGKWFLGHVVHAKHASPLTQNALQYCRDWGLESKAMSESINTAGGFLVPPDFGNDIIDLREQYGVFRRNAKVVPMSSETKSEPRRTAGLTVYYPGEGSAITASDKTFDSVNLVAKKYAIMSIYSSELNEDAIIDIGNDLAQEIAYQFSYAEDDNGFNGTGTSAYCRTVGVRQRLLDVFTSSGGTGLIVGAGNAYSELTLANFHSVVGALPLYARGRAKWFCSSTFHEVVMARLQTAAGGNSVVDIANGGQPRFLGYPVELSQVFPATEGNSQVCVVFGDLMQAAMLGDRRQLTLAYSSEHKFAEDQLAIRGTQRIDINVHSVGATGTAGPVVGLITASS